MLHVGFTGTRDGMSDRQKLSFSWLIRQLLGNGLTLHHGDCMGADEQAHDLAIQTTSHIVIHPPENTMFAAHKSGYSSVVTRLDPKPYMHRNRDIVKSSSLLIATPRTMVEETRSGTWATVRFARTQRCMVLVLDP